MVYSAEDAPMLHTGCGFIVFVNLGAVGSSGRSPGHGISEIILRWLVDTSIVYTDRSSLFRVSHIVWFLSIQSTARDRKIYMLETFDTLIYDLIYRTISICE